jgi:hypothetical protein
MNSVARTSRRRLRSDFQLLESLGPILCMTYLNGIIDGYQIRPFEADRGLQAAAWRNGTTHVVFEPLEFLAQLAALTPRPEINAASGTT